MLLIPGVDEVGVDEFRVLEMKWAGKVFEDGEAAGRVGVEEPVEEVKVDKLVGAVGKYEVRVDELRMGETKSSGKSSSEEGLGKKELVVKELTVY